MRLVVAIEGMFAFGGTERQAVDVAIGMNARGHDVTVLSRWPLDVDNVFLNELREHDVGVVSRGWGGPQRRRRVRVIASRAVSLGRVDALRAHAWRWQVGQLRKLASEQATVVHEIPFYGDVTPQGVAAHRRIRLPVVQTILGTPSAAVRPAAPWAIVTSDGAPRVDGPDEWMWIPTMGPPDDPGPVRLSPKDGVWRAVFVGRMVPPKGAELLIRAWAQLPGSPQLTVIGDGPGMAAVTKLVSELRANVVLAGALGRPEILRELERAHLLVAPSMLEDGVSFEGVPTVLAEGMWAGIPVVASRVGGVERLFAGDQPGWLVEPGDEQALVDALTAATNPIAYSRAAHAACRVFEHLLAPGAVLDRYEVAYDRALAAWA
jgi:glycosyltransferase involved in cell wall biosynthesis